jgi:hypothetical protein
VREPGENGECRRLVEPIVGIDVRDVLIGLRVSRYFHVAVEAEDLADRHFHVRKAGDLFSCGGQLILRDLGTTEVRFGRVERGAASSANLAET